ncbi:unnamed protein product [Hermetia illucens]|uniref:Uncharacterized protein n=1 Tax=Hermetia illucens TaxID=343691 RepID=A0A7R8V565_HERIL|nr:unnamed protein product [Hermetia illucens]
MRTKNYLHYKIVYHIKVSNDFTPKTLFYTTSAFCITSHQSAFILNVADPIEILQQKIRSKKCYALRKHGERMLSIFQ